MGKGKNRTGKGKSGGMGEMFNDLYNQIRMLHMGYTILLALGFASSFIIWWYVFVGIKPFSSRILIVQGVSALLIFLAYLYRIVFIGYDDRLWHNFRNTWIADTIISFIGFFIAQVSFVGSPDGMTSEGMYTFMRFITNIFGAIVLSLIPALIITFVIWFIVGIVEFFTIP